MKKILLILAVALLLEIPSVYAADETENVEINTEDINVYGEDVKKYARGKPSELRQSWFSPCTPFPGHARK